MKAAKMIKIQTIMNIQNLTDFKVHFAVQNRDGVNPLDVFVNDPDEWKGWNSWRGDRDDFSRKYIFGLIRYYHQPQKWLFGGIFKVLDRKSDSYHVELDELHKEFIGRLLINHPGAGTQGRAFYLENYFENFEVSQIFDKPFEGEAFCGYENVAHSFSQMESIIKMNKIDWKTALQNVKGVYLITDKSNGKQYVGAAYGDSGIWSRWSCYIGTGHGWNDELTKLISTNGIGYARDNFQFSILEFRPMRTDDSIIIEREKYWKIALQTRAFGYNKN